MANTNNDKKGFGARINAWLDEPRDQIFKAGKWRFWFPMVIGFSLLNAALTAMVFGAKGNLETFMGVVLLGVGALLAWLCVGSLHYSDSEDERMSKGVSRLDSVTLIFVIAHFCFLVWILGHIRILQSREIEYTASAQAFNSTAEKMSSDQVKIAEAHARAEKLRNDTTYQERKIAQITGAIFGRKSKPQNTSLPSNAPIELERPTKPKESSTDFLAHWDWWVRVANLGELILAAFTFIYIRNRSAWFNAQQSTSLPYNASGLRARGSHAPFSAGSSISTQRTQETTGRHVSTQRAQETTGRHSVSTQSALAIVREHLRRISFYLPGFSFKADINGNALFIRMMKSQGGREVTVNTVKTKHKILNDALTLDDATFHQRLIVYLQKRGFTI